MSEVVGVRGCQFPIDLRYDVPNHMWYEPLASGRVRCGMTVVGSALADMRIYAVAPKRVGRDLEAGKSFATIESSKWVGPARIAFDGVVVEINQRAIDNPSLLVEDAYGDGWLLIAQPSTDSAVEHLLTGKAVGAAYEACMSANDFRGCVTGTGK